MQSIHDKDKQISPYRKPRQHSPRTVQTRQSQSVAEACDIARDCILPGSIKQLQGPYTAVRARQ